MQANLVELTPAQGPSGVTWTMCHKACGGPGNYPDIVLTKGSGAHTIIFSIEDPSNLGVRFPNKAEDAIYIQPNTKPQQKTFDGAGQLDNPTLTKNKMTLIITDKNDQAMDFHYSLQFSDGSKIDPVIKNGGGGLIPESGTSAALWLVGAAVVGALLYAGIRRLLA